MRSPIGLSPRGRGKRRHDGRRGGRIWSIPAWAGETSQGAKRPCALGVYPRVGGGNLTAYARLTHPYGLSPRGRGKPRRRPGVDIVGSIPAWAGETGQRACRRSSGAVYPRVGGGNPGGFLRRLPGGGLSPRGRGKPAALHAVGQRARSIPAWAGETITLPALWATGAVYPRVGGGNRGYHWDDAAGRGLSPRGRGKQLQ